MSLAARTRGSRTRSRGPNIFGRSPFVFGQHLFVAIGGDSLSSPSFILPLTDAGSGAVNLTPSYALGSYTPTFTRATTAYTLLSTGLYALVNSGVARSYYSPAGVYLGYLAEGARADVLGTTAAIRRTMTDVGWVATNVTVTAATGIDGVASAGATLTATANNATILFTPGLIAGVRTYCAWVARKTGTGAVSMTADVADGYVVQTLTATAAQYQVTSSSAVPVVGFKFATSGDAITVDFNTLEAATFANPTPIPVNVSKAADVLTYPSAGNISNTVGTVYAEFTTAATGTAAERTVIGANTNTGYMGMLTGAGNPLGLNDGTSNRSFGLNVNIPVSTPVKAATQWGGSATNGALNGTIGTPAGFDGDMSQSSPFYIGDVSASNRTLFGTICNVRLYPVALSAAQLQAMTS